jgi:hypothetical protein
MDMFTFKGVRSNLGVWRAAGWLAVVGLVVGAVLAPGTIGASPNGPAGNNGTVKIHDGADEPDPEVRNEPHVCTFHLHFFFADPEQAGTWEIRKWAPGAKGAIVMDGTYDTNGDGEDRQPETGAYSLPDGHYKLFWDGDDGKHDKMKVFWVECAPASASPSGSVEASESASPSPSESEEASESPSPSPSGSVEASESASPSPSESEEASESPSPSESEEASESPSASPSGSVEASESASPSPSESEEASASPSGSVEASASASIEVSPPASVEASASASTPGGSVLPTSTTNVSPSPSESESATPTGSVEGAVGTPPTLPPTDTVGGAAPSGAPQGWRIALLALAAILGALLILVPAPRRIKGR